MNSFDPAKLVGHYFVLDPPVASVFASPDGRSTYRVRRHWPFHGRAINGRSLAASNPSTGHQADFFAGEVLGVVGDLDAPPDYFRPLVLRLRTQVCWNAVSLWREPLPCSVAPTYHRRRRLHRRQRPSANRA